MGIDCKFNESNIKVFKATRIDIFELCLSLAKLAECKPDCVWERENLLKTYNSHSSGNDNKQKTLKIDDFGKTGCCVQDRMGMILAVEGSGTEHACLQLRCYGSSLHDAIVYVSQMPCLVCKQFLDSMRVKRVVVMKINEEVQVEPPFSFMEIPNSYKAKGIF